MNKKDLLDRVVEALQQELAVMANAVISARTAATEAEAKPENKYDTRGLEQSYLADGQAKRVQDLQKSIHHLKNLNLQKFDSSSVVEISAIVELQSEEGENKTYFMLPEKGGLKIRQGLREIITISPDSPLGNSLLGKKVGESFELKLGGQTKIYEVLKLI